MKDRTDHAVAITGPTPDGLWGWRCTDSNCTEATENTGYFDIGECMTFAGAHGVLADSVNPELVKWIYFAASDRTTFAGKVNGLDQALAFYDTEVIPRYREKFPQSLAGVLAQREAFAARRAYLLDDASQSV